MAIHSAKGDANLWAVALHCWRTFRTDIYSTNMWGEVKINEARRDCFFFFTRAGHPLLMFFNYRKFSNKRTGCCWHDGT